MFDVCCCLFVWLVGCLVVVVVLVVVAVVVLLVLVLVVLATHLIVAFLWAKNRHIGGVFAFL